MLSLHRNILRLTKHFHKSISLNKRDTKVLGAADRFAVFAQPLHFLERAFPSVKIEQDPP